MKLKFNFNFIPIHFFLLFISCPYFFNFICLIKIISKIDFCIDFIILQVFFYQILSLFFWLLFFFCFYNFLNWFFFDFIFQHKISLEFNFFIEFRSSISWVVSLEDLPSSRRFAQVWLSLCIFYFYSCSFDYILKHLFN